jgi:energy-coupling factor transporter ATP-binding protein EcfA2
MHHRTRSTLLGLGFDSDLVEKIGRLNHTVEILRSFGERRLLEHYTAAETALIRAKLERTPIPPETVERILALSGRCCCVCRDGINIRPYQLHHARPYAETQDHSEGNLILVCPTHHAVFHQSPIAEIDQLKARDSWYALCKLARDFAEKGVAYPHGAFDPIDFSAPPDFGDLVELSPLTPATAAACLPPDFAAAGLALLKAQRSLMVIGASGAGKSTYALGLAGRMHSDTGVRVFRYLRRQRDSDSLGELTSALCCVAHPTLFIVDDLNSWAALPAIEKLVEIAVASPKVHLLATISAEDTGPVERLSHISRPHQVLVWENLRDTLAANLIAHEHQAVDRLARIRQAGNTHVDHGRAFWKQDVGEAAQSAQSAYDLVFRIRGSREGARETARVLADRESSYLVVLAAAIEQIAGFERPVLPAEVTTLLQALPSPPGIPAPSVSWVESVRDRGVRQRHLTIARGAYTTVHRRWATHFIDECLATPAAQGSSRQLLRQEFSRGFRSPERLTRLWSWFFGKPACESFCHEWMQSLGRVELSSLGARLLEAGLDSFSFFVHQSFFFSKEESAKEILRNLLADHESRLTVLVRQTDPAAWRSLKDLFNITESVAPELLRRLLAAWPVEQAARLVGTTLPSQYANLFWTLSSVSKVAPEWLAHVGRELSWTEIKRSFESTRPGMVSELDDFLHALAVMRFTFMRSMSRDYLTTLGRALENVSLDDLNVGFVDTWLGLLVALFNEEADREFARIDHARWARELTSGSSRPWEVLPHAYHLFAMAGSMQLQKVFALIDRTRLAALISRHGAVYGQELRWVLFITATFDQADRDHWSQFCIPHLEAILSAKAAKSAEVLIDFSRLDPLNARRLAARHGITIEAAKPFPNFPLILSAQRAECRRKDALGTDYDTELLRWDEPTTQTTPSPSPTSAPQA